MSKTNTITLRIPEELKRRIEKIAKKQGVSMNQFAMYALTKEAGELEASKWFKSYLKDKRKEEIYADFNEALPSPRHSIRFEVINFANTFSIFD